MADFNRGRSRGGNFRRGGFDRPQMYKAVCDKCRKDCEVPFRPTSGKPVYCNDCFDRPTSRRPEGRGFSRNNFEEKSSTSQYEQQFALLNSKLDQVLKILTPIIRPEGELQSTSIAAEAEEAEVEPEEIVEPANTSKKSSSKEK